MPCGSTLWRFNLALESLLLALVLFPYDLLSLGDRILLNGHS